MEKQSKKTNDSPTDENYWTTIIKPDHKFLDLKLREVIKYRDLIGLFIKRDFTTQYKQTILGPLWFIIQPLLSTALFSFIFGSLAQISTNGIPHVLFYYAGTMLWTYFERSFRDASDTFTNNADVFGKVYFPRLTVPISRVFINMVTLGIQFALLLIFYFFYILKGNVVIPSWSILFFPLILIWIASLGLGMGLIISAITTKYRDLKQLISFGISLWMYATPIVYPLSQVPENLLFLYNLNPVSAPIECFRIIFYSSGNISFLMIFSSISMTVLFLFLGLVSFSKGEKTFIDVI